MDQVNRILTCAYNKKPIPNLIFQDWSEPGCKVWTFLNNKYGHFQMVKNRLLNIVMVQVKLANYICLVVEGKTYYWKDTEYYQSGYNFIHRTEYPALANFVFISWTEKFLTKWLLSKHKPFASHLSFSPKCPLGLGNNSSNPKILNLCIDLWPEGELTNWEMESIKPWNLKKTNIADYQAVLSFLIDKFNKLPIESSPDEIFRQFIIFMNLNFVDLPFKLLESSLQRSISIPWLRERWPVEMSSKRAQIINQVYQS